MNYSHRLSITGLSEPRGSFELRIVPTESLLNVHGCVLTSLGDCVRLRLPEAV
jgi:hypothetical protein